MTIDVSQLHVETDPTPATIDVSVLRLETDGLVGSASIDVSALRIETNGIVGVATIDVSALRIELDGDNGDEDWWVCTNGVLVPIIEKLVCVDGVLVL